MSPRKTTICRRRPGIGSGTAGFGSLPARAEVRSRRAKFLSTIPMGRFSTPEDMGNAAAFLCSDEASMITGVAMEVDGGRCI